MPYKDSEQRKLYMKKYQQEHLKEHNAACKKYNSSEKGKSVSRKSDRKHRQTDERKRYLRKWRSERKKIDIGFRIRCNASSRLSHALKGNLKSDKTISLLGCSIEELRKYLEVRFNDEMNWANYGSYWEIDHILPCASFDLSKEEEQMKCFHYSNLQPLTCHDNRAKSDRMVI